MMLEPDYPLAAGRLTLRPFGPGDRDDVLAYRALPEVARYVPFEPLKPDDADAWLADSAGRTVLKDEGDFLRLAIDVDGAAIGDAVLFWRSREHRQGEVGYALNPAYRGHGYATEAARALLRLGFEDLGLHRIIGRIDARNQASERVLARLGMRREAHFVQNEIMKGEWTDEVVYALLRAEWDVLR
jgi:RimJ/RimL family protein N-acetyltransferase